MKNIFIVILLMINFGVTIQQIKASQQQHVNYDNSIDKVNGRGIIGKKKNIVNRRYLQNLESSKSLPENPFDYLKSIKGKDLTYEGLYSPAPVDPSALSSRTQFFGEEGINKKLSKGLTYNDNPKYYEQQRNETSMVWGITIIIIIFIVVFVIKDMQKSGFTQAITNTYIPYNENLIKSNFESSFISAAYDDCHLLVGKSLDSSIYFKKKCALEIMLFLIAAGLKQLASIKHTSNSELSIPIMAIAVALTSSLKDELYELVEAKGDVTNFLNDRIEDYINMLDNYNISIQHTIMLLFLEKPLAKIEKEEEYDYEAHKYLTYYSVDTDGTTLKKDIEMLLKIQPLITLAVNGMRKSVKKMYGLA